MRKVTLLFAVALALGVLASGAWASTGFDPATMTYQWDSDDFETDSIAGWGFANVYEVDGTPGADQLLTLKLYVGDQTSGELTASIWTPVSSLPGSIGTLQNSVNVDLASAGASLAGGWLTLDVASWNTSGYLDTGDSFAIGYETDKRDGVAGMQDTDGVGGDPVWSRRKDADGNLTWVQETEGDWGIRATTAPEPASLVLLGCAAGAGAWVRKRKTSKTK